MDDTKVNKLKASTIIIISIIIISVIGIISTIIILTKCFGSITINGVKYKKFVNYYEVVEINTKEVYIKDEIKGLKVIEFNDNLMINEDITKIVFGKNIVKIKEKMFAGIKTLEEIDFKDNNAIDSIGKDAFIDCISLSHVNINNIKVWQKIKFENENSNPIKYAKSLYVNGYILENLQVVQNLNNYAFYNCESIVAVNFAKNIKFIGKNCFKGCIFTQMEFENIYGWYVSEDIKDYEKNNPRIPAYLECLDPKLLIEDYVDYYIYKVEL